MRWVLLSTECGSNMTVATWITLSRLLAVPFLLYGLYRFPADAVLPSDGMRWVCLAVFLLAAGTDWLDGYVARRWNQVSDLGKVLDPLVDKLLVLTPLLCLVELDRVPAWSVFLILGRELAIAGWRVNQATISGANIWGKAKTVSQIVAIALLIAPLAEEWQVLTGVAYGCAIVLTLVSGVLYVWPRQSTL